MALINFGLPHQKVGGIKPPFGTRLRRGHWSAQGLCLLWAFNETNEFDVISSPTYRVHYEQVGYRSMDISFNGDGNAFWQHGQGSATFPKGFASGPRGQSGARPWAFLDGTSSRQPLFDFTKGITIEYRCGVGSDVTRPILSCGETGTPSRVFRVDSGISAIDFQLSPDGTDTNAVLCRISAFDGAHFFAVWSPVDGLMRYYGDGIEQTAPVAFAGPIHIPAVVSWTAPCQQAWGGGGVDSDLFIGKIALYNRALGAQEIKYLTFVDEWPMFAPPGYFAQSIVADPPVPGDPGPGEGGGGLAGDVDICSLIE